MNLIGTRNPLDTDALMKRTCEKQQPMFDFNSALPNFDLVQIQSPLEQCLGQILKSFPSRAVFVPQFTKKNEANSPRYNKSLIFGCIFQFDASKEHKHKYKQRGDFCNLMWF